MALSYSSATSLRKQIRLALPSRHADPSLRSVNGEGAYDSVQSYTRATSTEGEDGPTVSACRTTPPLTAFGGSHAFGSRIGADQAISPSTPSSKGYNGATIPPPPCLFPTRQFVLEGGLLPFGGTFASNCSSSGSPQSPPGFSGHARSPPAGQGP